MCLLGTLRAPEAGRSTSGNPHSNSALDEIQPSGYITIQL